MHTETLTYAVDGLTFKSTLFSEGTTPRPGVLVFADAMGIGKNVLANARRLSELGYAAMVCDYFGDAKLFARLEDAMPIIKDLRANPETPRARGRAALEALAARSEVDATKIAALGYFLGGTMALELARSGANLAAAVGFHTGLATTRPAAANTFRAKVLVCNGAEDSSISDADRAAFENEMRAAGADWQLHIYGGVVHSFTQPDAADRGRPEFARYDAAADRRSWAAMKMLFEDVFGL